MYVCVCVCVRVVWVCVCARVVWVCVCFIRRNSNPQMNEILCEISCAKHITGSGVHSASQEPGGFRNQMT